MRTGAFKSQKPGVEVLPIWRNTRRNGLPVGGLSGQQAALKFDDAYAIASPVKLWTGSLFSALNPSNTNQHPTSPDGKTWTNRTFPYTQVWRGIANNGAGRSIAIGGTNTTLAGVSTDGGITWGPFAMASSADWGQIATLGSLWLAVVNAASFGTNYSTNGGVSFNTGTAPTTINAVVAAGNRFFVGSGGVGSHYSLDAQNYTVVTGLSSVTMVGIAFGNGLYGGPLTGATNKFAYSRDGAAFKTSILPVTDTWNAPYFDPYSGLFVLTPSTATGVILTSPDCEKWTQRKNLDLAASPSAPIAGPLGFVVQQSSFLRLQDKDAVESTYITP